MGIRHRRRLIITRGLAVDQDLDILINSYQGELFKKCFPFLMPESTRVILQRKRLKAV
jgi:hypothetical protein